MIKALIISLLLIVSACGRSQHQIVTINGPGQGVSINGTGKTVDPASIYHNTNNLWPELTRTTKPLLKIAVVGNSLMGNFIGGSLPVDEGDGMRPMRLTVNNIPRRIYDQLSWNKATHRRLDHTDWTWSSSWSEYNTVFEPTYTNEKIYQTSTSGNYAEITVPDGMENFAIIFQKAPSLATFTVTLNGGSIASYGNSSVVTARTALSGEQNGNPYHIEQYLGLPAGANTIRITKSANGSTGRLWGGFWWTGNTLIVHNLGHGGHTMQELMTEHLRAEVDDNDYDAIIFEVTEINELSQTNDIDQSAVDLQTLLTNHIGATPALIMSTNILGTDPSDGTPNYYVTLPGHKTLNTRLIGIAKTQYPTIDVFTGFERIIVADGGSLAAGDGGDYTSDGQHPNTTGVEIWFNFLYPVLRKVLKN